MSRRRRVPTCRRCALWPARTVGPAAARWRARRTPSTGSPSTSVCTCPTHTHTQMDTHNTYAHRAQDSHRRQRHKARGFLLFLFTSGSLRHINLTEASFRAHVKPTAPRRTALTVVFYPPWLWWEGGNSLLLPLHPLCHPFPPFCPP